VCTETRLRLARAEPIKRVSRERIRQIKNPQAAPDLHEALEAARSFAGEGLHGALVGRFGLFVGDELADFGLLSVTDRLLERDWRARRELDRLDLVRIDARYELRDLLGGRFAAEGGDELADVLQEPLRGIGAGSSVRSFAVMRPLRICGVRSMVKLGVAAGSISSTSSISRHKRPPTSRHRSRYDQARP
jgi:hypothetical protein